MTIGLSAGCFHAQTAIPIEKLERGFEATRDHLKDGGIALTRVVNQPLPISVTGTAIQNPESSEIHHAAAETEPISTGSKQQDKRRRLALAGTLMLILFVIAWRGSRPPASRAPNRRYVRIPSPILAAHLAGHRTPVDDHSHVTEYKTAKILPGKLIVVDDRNGAQETEVIYLTDPSGMGEVEIGRECPDVTDGVRIKDKANTLSRRQARLVYSAQTGKFRLVNLAGKDSNPIAINGRRMANQETVLLGNNDILQMGTVRLKFSQ